MAAADPVPTGAAGTGTSGLSKYIEDYLAGYSRSHPNIVLVVGRSKDQNVAVYEALVDRGGLVADKPIDGYWLNADPENVTKNRLAGRLDDREEFGMIESSMTYGVSFSSAGVGTYTVTLSSIPGRVFTLSMVDGHPRLQTHIAGQHAFIERAFLETKDGMLGSKVLWTDLYGRSSTTGEVLHERIPE